MESIHISSITQAELIFGAEKSERRSANVAKLSDFLAHLTVLPWDSEAALQYGKLRTQLERAGTPIGNMDMLIAAHVLSLRAKLVTNNTKHFEKIPRLKLENWV